MRVWRPLFYLVIMLIPSCGYNFAGMGSGLPEDIKKLEIPLFRNKTSHAGIENAFTNSLIREFNQSKRLRVVQKKDADAVIFGVVKVLKDSPLSYSPTKTVIENRLTLYLDVTLKRSASKEIIWRDSNLSGSEDYTVASDITTSERNKDEAILKIAKILSERIHNRIFESF